MSLATTNSLPTNELTPDTLEAVIVGGDLSKLNPKQRLSWYLARCDAAGLDPRTQPFVYLNLSGKMVLYATKAASDGLIGNRGLNVEIIERRHDQDLGIYEVRCRVTLPTGRTVEDVGAVYIGTIKGEPLCNAIMKAVTKAKRRTVLSACGLGIPDESEADQEFHYPTPMNPQLGCSNGNGKSSSKSDEQHHPEPALPGQNGFGPDPRPYHAVVTNSVAAVNERLREFDCKTPIDPNDVHRYLVHEAIQADYFTGPRPPTVAKAIAAMAAVYGKQRDWVRHRLIAFLQERIDETEEAIQAQDEPVDEVQTEVVNEHGEVLEPGTNG